MHERYPQAANGSFSGVIRTIDGAEVYYYGPAFDQLAELEGTHA